MTGACAVPGGVSAVNLGILHALLELQQERGFALKVMSYDEKAADRPGFLPEEVPFRAYERNKLRFAVDLVRESVSRPLMLFDYVRLASPVLPLSASGMLKTVVFAHGIEYWKDVRISDRWSLRFADRVLTNSEYTLRRMQQANLRFRGTACPLGLSPGIPLNSRIPDPSPDRPMYRASDGHMRPLGNRVLLLVARMNQSERYKGHYPLIRVLPELLKRHPDTQLVFPGPGDDQENLRAFADELGVGAHVFVPGFIALDELNQLYRNCYAFVMPSTCEGFGVVHLEAMNSGKPCVGCFDDGAEDVIVHEKTGYLLHDPEDATELFGVLDHLLQDSHRARKMGEAGFERLHEHFSAERFKRRFKAEIAGYFS